MIASAYYTDTATRWALLALAFTLILWVVWASRNVTTRAERDPMTALRHAVTTPIPTGPPCDLCGYQPLDDGTLWPAATAWSYPCAECLWSPDATA